MLEHHRDDAFKNGAPMIFHFRAVSATEPAELQNLTINSSRREQIITVFAASLAMLIVATIALLMGMA